MNTEKVYELVKSNLSDQKFYSEGYKEIEKKMKLSKNDINVILEYPFVSKFYRNESTRILSKWLE